MISLQIDAEKCNKCGICVYECPGDLIQIVEEGALPSWINRAESGCLKCGHCVAICPTGALELSTTYVSGCVPVSSELQSSPEQLEQFLKSRRSIRAYKDKPVERKKLEKLIDIARYAPSGHNGQPVQWLVIEKREKVKELARITIDWLTELIEVNPELAKALVAKPLIRRWNNGRDVIARGAPHMILAHANKASNSAVDCQIALTYLELAAHSMGLGACWAGYVHGAAVHSEAAHRMLQLPEGHVVYGAMMVGYPEYKFARIPPRNDTQILWR